MQTQKLRLPKNDPLAKELELAKRNYLTLKLLLDDIKKRAEKENASLYAELEKEMDGQDRDEIENPLWEKVAETEKRLGQPQTHELLVKATQMLIQTGAEVIKKISPEMFSQVAIVFDPTQNWTVKDKVIDLTLSLDPTK